MDLLKNCLNSLNNEQNDQNTGSKNLVSFVQSNEHFNFFVKQLSFNEYISKYTDECLDNIEIDPDKFLLKSLANSITDYKVMDIIAKNLINNYK